MRTTGLLQPTTTTTPSYNLPLVYTHNEQSLVKEGRDWRISLDSGQVFSSLLEPPPPFSRATHPILCPSQLQWCSALSQSISLPLTLFFPYIVVYKTIAIILIMLRLLNEEIYRSIATVILHSLQKENKEINSFFKSLLTDANKQNGCTS